ncbi:hypothetical protein QVD17_10620 [Tagetes erecta]|uniref:Transmembrane protein n=1 Tax=Tagetes erecta TaxID=13708 RepID=A0AAD8L9P7_TARER|nr:hypothetical protein QVD17_10620 [Tagetes erecta]
MAAAATSSIKIIRTSIHTFLQHYNYFTTITFLSLPFSASILISSPSRVQSLFPAPPESQFFSILNLKLSQTISSSLLVLPFSLSFLLISKSFIIHKISNSNSISRIFISILKTQICNTLIILSANATCFWLLFIAFNCLQNLNIAASLFFNMFSGIIFSIVITNALITCNMALILSGMELSGGFMSILKACVMIRGRTSIALSLALPVNIALAGIEFLFQFRVVKAYSDSGHVNTHTPSLSMVLEGLFIAYLYSVVITIDVLIGCVFFNNCKRDYHHNIVDDQEAARIKQQDVELVKFVAKDFS